MEKGRGRQKGGILKWARQGGGREKGEEGRDGIEERV